MRDSGYKNAAYAIAELVDNALQAGASTVEILCEEREEFVKQRTRRRVHRIAVADNGCGMDATTLRMALQYGNGTRLSDRSGMGRFGMGLPNSSLSQATHVDVYSWQDGIRNALHSYLDVEQICTRRMREVPSPVPAEVPHGLVAASATMSRSKAGTLVVWSGLDRCDWKTANAVFKNSEFTIGRVYRKLICDGKAQIRMVALGETPGAPYSDDYVLPNDPLYLLASKTSCPEPWDSTPMFEDFGEACNFKWCTADGNVHEVKVRFSVAKKEARVTDQAGRKPHGQHAKRNIGVSVVRAGRELELQLEWCIGYDPKERWWGAEVEFSPALDEIFGVTNNKQSATALAEFGKLDIEQVAQREGYSTPAELLDAWRDDADGRQLLVEIKNAIEKNLKAIRDTLKAQSEGRRSKKRHADPLSAEVVGTKATNRRKEEGHHGASDAGEFEPAEQRANEIRESLVAEGVDESDAEERAAGLVHDGRKYEFYKADLHSAEFFTVRRKGGALLIGINTNHPAYDHLLSLLEHGEDEQDVARLQAQVQRSYEALKLLLEAWARYEDELPDGARRSRAQETRVDWGRMARTFFGEEE